MKVAVVTPAMQDPDRLFGAERHFVGMVEAFRQKVDTEWIQMPISEATWEDVLRSYLDCYDLDLYAYDLVISTKNPTFMVQHPNQVCWLLHQIRVFYDRFDDEYGKLDQAQLAEKRGQRETIQLLDNLAFQGVRKIFTNGYETARRLKQYNGFDAEVLHPPVLTRGQYCAGQQYFLLPGRLHRWKRVDLALRAMQHLKPDVPLLIPGTGEDESYFRELAKNDPRITFLGFVTDQELLDLYANALAVLFVPKDEDFGYITIEAMLSHKPVIVCTDSGEPTRLVENGRSGFVVKPDTAEIAAAMSVLAKDRELARDMGEYAFAHVPSQSWSAVVEKLLQPTNVSSIAHQFTDIAPRRTHHPEVRVLVTDNQVLEPAVGGSRVRAKEVCKGLASRFSTEYIGAFDWEGPRSTDETPPGWRCRVFALSKLHYWLSNHLQRWVKGGSVIDVSFSILAHTSRTFLRTLRESVKQADVVVFCHPWCYPLAKSLLGGKYIIYDGHNFEWGLRSDLLSSTVIGRKLAANVKRVEGDLVKRSDQVWVCSTEDANAMSQVYGVPRERCRLVPNCADTHGLVPADSHQRDAAKRTMGWEGRSVVAFVGSGGYRPNTEAAAFIIEELAPQFPETVFAIAGSVKEDYLRGRTATELAERFAPPRVPCCLGVGWYEVEDWGVGKQARWTAPEFTVETFRRGGMLTLRVKSPNRNHVAVRQGERKILDFALAEGENTLVIEYPTSGPLRFQLRHEHRFASDPRTLGCAVLSLDWQSHEGNGASLPLQKADLQALLPGNVALLGVVSEDKLYTVLHATDVALNPVEMGSGTSLKLLQYMAAGLPVISTEAGVRGIETGGELCVVSPRASFAAALQEVLRYPDVREALGNSGREEVERNYDWRVVTNRAAEDVSKLLKYRRRNELPFFSVVIPTYNRPDRLTRALTALSRQTFPDFEVVVVDQSHPPVQVPAKLQNDMRVKYIHSTERGSALARNKGWKSAAGLVIAFTDDDCVPGPDWLENAARYFDEHLIAGLEGRVRSKEVGNPLYRTVCNVGFEGIGYMTANMFYRRDLLSKVDGFDERFKFAFREDTDLAWRVLEYGEIPFAADAAVFHPPHRVEIERESPAERAKMFSVDPILFERHPRKYIDLLCREGHYRNMIGFWQHFARGLSEYESHAPVHELLRGLRDYDPDWWRSVSGMAADSDSQGLDARDLTALRSLMHADQ